MAPLRLRTRRAFTLVELLLVFAIASVLVGLLLPAIQKMRERASAKWCSNNLRQIGAGFLRMHDAHHKLPPALGWYPMTAFPGKPQTGSYGNPFFHLLPFIGQGPLFQSTATETAAGPVYRPWQPDESPAFTRPIDLFVCPSDPGNTGVLDNGWAGSSYAYNFQVFGIVGDCARGLAPSGNCWGGATRIPACFPDGTTRTIMAAERYARCGDVSVYWGGYDGGLSMPVFAMSAFGFQEVGPLSKFQVQPSPFNQPYDGSSDTGCDPRRTSTGHPAGMQALFADAHVTTLSATIDPIVWWYRCGGGDFRRMDEAY
jgi:type II secretory pathway pseudopilin PulG